VALSILVSGCSETSTDGAVLYRKFCAACHGSDLSGGVGTSLAAGTRAAAQDDAAYRAVIRDGTTGMPATGLDELQIDAVIAYVRQLQGE
jgi:mono/diheme cytochrome c family protein